MKTNVGPTLTRPTRAKLPERDEAVFWNLVFDKSRLRAFVSWFLKTYGEKKTLALLERLKQLGFEYATKAGISLGVEDLQIPDQKNRLLAKAQAIVSESNFLYRKGRLTGLEKMQKFIETWHETSETLKDDVVRNFEKTNILNPVYMMAFSGARGNMSQVRQLVGMRGLMADPQGKIIDFPIQSNFREGLTLTEYLISTYGARKGIVDTALRTATAGYLTRRLVDVAQHVIVSKFDCSTRRGIYLFDMKEGNKILYSFQNRLIGRVLAHDVSDGPAQAPPVAFRNQEVTPELASTIAQLRKKALVRSPLTCESRKLVCQLCYGWSLATSRLVSIGEAVGVIAGQSIGEPGTQLTMRTFHTGGVFAAGVTQQINAPFAGTVEYADPIAGTCVRTPHGELAFLTKAHGVLFLKQTSRSKQDEVRDELSGTQKTYKIPPFTILFVRHGQSVEQDALVCQISSLPINVQATQTIEQTIYSTFEGEVYYDEIDLNEDVEDKYGERISTAEDWSKVWLLSGKLYEDALDSKFLPSAGDFVGRETVVEQVGWIAPFRSSSPNWVYGLERSTRSRRSHSGTHDRMTRKTPGNQDARTTFGELPDYRLTALYAVKRRFLEAQTPPSFWPSKPDETRFKPRASMFQSPYALQTDDVGRFDRSTATLSRLARLERSSSLGSLSRLFSIQDAYSARERSTFSSTKRVRADLVPRRLGSISAHRSHVDDRPKRSARSPRETSILKTYVPFVLRPKTLRTYFRLGRTTNVNTNPSSFYRSRLKILRDSLIQKERVSDYGNHSSTKEERMHARFKRQDGAGKEGLIPRTKKASSRFDDRPRPAGPRTKKIEVSFPLVSLKARSAKYSRLGYVLSLDVPTDRFFVSSPLSVRPIADARNEIDGVRTLVRKKASTSTFSFDWFPDVESYNLRGILFVNERSSFDELFKRTLRSIDSPAKSGTKQGTRAFDFKKTWPVFDLSHSQLQKAVGPRSKTRRLAGCASNRFFSTRAHTIRHDERQADDADRLRLLSLVSRTSQNRARASDIAFSTDVNRRTSLSAGGIPFRKSKAQNSKYLDEGPEKTSTETKQLLSATARKDFQTLKNAFLKLNVFEKPSSCSNEIEWLKQENHRFRVDKKTIAPNVFELRPRFSRSRAVLDPESDEVRFYLSNPQGSKQRLFFKQEGLLTLKARSDRTERCSDQRSSKSRNAPVFKEDPRKTFRLVFDSPNPIESRGRGRQALGQLLRRDFFAHLAEKASTFESEKHLPSKQNRQTFETFCFSSDRIERSDCFTFLPFLEPKNAGRSPSFDRRESNEMLRSEFGFVDLSLKPGWVYRSNCFSKILGVHKSQLRAATELLENVAFEQNKVFPELLSQPAASKSLRSSELFLEIFKPYRTDSAPVRFAADVHVRNSQARFLSRIGSASSGSKGSFLVLIRPVYSKSFPTEHDMKTQLYERVKSTQRLNYLLSARCRASYASNSLNPQKNNLKTIGHFVPVDLEVATRSIRRIASQSNLEVAPLAGSRSKVRNATHPSTELSKTGPSAIEGRGPKKASNLPTKGYFSNRVFNFFRVNVSFLDDCPGARSRTALSFSRLSIHRNRSNKAPLASSADRGRDALRRANDRKNSDVVKNRWCSDRTSLSTILKDFWSFESDRDVGGFSNVDGFDRLPVFEYSFCSLHAYLAHQRIFAAFFSNFSNLLPSDETPSRFVERTSTSEVGADAFTNLPKATSSLVLRNGELTETVGSTGFRIPFEGEVLKGSAENDAFADLEKHANVHLERGLGQESRLPKIILTKADVVGLRFVFEPSTPDQPRFESPSRRADRPNDVSRFFQTERTKQALASLLRRHSTLRVLEQGLSRASNERTYKIGDFKTTYGNKTYRLNAMHLEFLRNVPKLRLGEFVRPGQKLYGEASFVTSGQIIHLNSRSVTLRKAEFFSVSPKAILHTYNRAGLSKNVPVMTLPFETLKTGDIVQGIPKVEQYLEARTTIKGRLFLNSLPVLLEAIHHRYVRTFELEKAVRQSFLKIQQILVDGVQRVYRSQGVSIADKHLEVIVRQMTSKVRIVHGAQTGFFSGELVDLEFVERLNRFLKVKIRYEPVVLGITRASLEVDSFLSAASFQQTTKVLTRAAVENRRDFLRGLKESLLVGNLLPAGTGYLVPFSGSSVD